MKIDVLDKKLNSAIKSFSDDIQSKYREGSKEPATYDDLNELARQTSYALDEFRKCIVEYLKKTSD